MQIFKLVKRKIKSETGATIALALLLFMVCVVIGGIILAAATASSGRFSELKKTDARYYAVMSSVELLAKELTEKTVTIQQTRVERQNQLHQTIGTPAYTTTINGIAESDGNPALVTDRSFLSARAVHLFYGPLVEANSAEAMGRSIKSGFAEESGETYRLAHQGDYQDCDVYWTYSMTEDGTLRLLVWNKKEADKYPFTVLVTLNAQTEESYSSSGGDIPDSVQEGQQETEPTFTIVSTKTSTIVWTLENIEVQGAV